MFLNLSPASDCMASARGCLGCIQWASRAPGLHEETGQADHSHTSLKTQYLPLSRKKLWVKTGPGAGSRASWNMAFGQSSSSSSALTPRRRARWGHYHWASCRTSCGLSVKVGGPQGVPETGLSNLPSHQNGPWACSFLPLLPLHYPGYCQARCWGVALDPLTLLLTQPPTSQSMKLTMSPSASHPSMAPQHLQG